MYQSGLMPTEAQRPSAYPVPGSYFGVTSEKSSGFPFGLFLGAVGALVTHTLHASQAMQQMQPATQEIAKLDLSAELTTLDVPPKPRGDAAPTSHIGMTPAAVLVFGKDDMLRMGCGVYAAHVDGGVTKSTRRYFVGEGRPFTAQTATVDALRQEARECLSRALEIFRWDRQQSDNKFAAVRVRVHGATQAIEVQAATAFLPSRLVMPDSLGLMQFPAERWAPGDR